MNNVEPKSKIKNKIIFLFSAFTFLLLSTIFLYLYVSGKNYINNSAVENNLQCKEIFETNLEEYVEKSINEIKALSNQLNQHNISSLQDISNPQNINIFQNFLFGYPENYSEIIIFSNAESNVISFSSRKLFTGKLEIVQKEKEKNLTQEIKLLNKINLRERKFEIVSSLNENATIFLLAKLSFNKIIKSAIEHSQFPQTTSLFVIDTAGITHFATEKKYINKNIYSFENLSQKNIRARFDQSGYSINSNEYAVISNYNIDLLQCNLLLSTDIKKPISELNSLALKTIVFTIILFVIVLLAVSMWANQLSKPLKQITIVSQKVSTGNFDDQIKMDRDDELGLLIKTFNEMIVKLKNSYEELRITNKELKYKIDELVITKNELSSKEKLAVIGETISVISHEIQNKIGGVSIWIQNLEMQINDETSIIYLEEMKKAMNSFMQMLVSFKKFYRQAPINKSSFNIIELVLKALTEFKTNLESKNINVEFSSSDDIKIIEADEKLIDEVIVNLLINSVYHSPKNGRIKINLWKQQKYFFFSVFNEGPLIKQADMEKIFQPFFTTKSSGSGLGLAIVQNIITAHNGSIKVKNVQESGVMFEVAIPIV